MSLIQASTLDSVWSHVIVTKDCWLWQNPKGGKGYGQFSRYRRHYTAHRFFYELLVGPIPDGLTLDHLCRTPECVNPAHLEPVTKVENLMRGNCLGAVNARKTHCKRGHAFDEENTYFNRYGGRMCRACANTRSKAARKLMVAA